MAGAQAEGEAFPLGGRPQLEEQGIPAGAQLKALRRTRRFKTNVWLVELDGHRYLLKEVSRMPWLLRITYGRMLIRREVRVFRRLEGLDGVPGLVAPLGPEAFLAEHVRGLPLDRRSAPFLPEDFFARLDRLVERIHQRGILHLDLGQRKNIILRSRDRRPVILDFGAALGCGLPRPLFRLLHLLLGWVDRRGVLMQRMRYGPVPLDERDRRALKRMNRVRALWLFNRPANPRRF